MSSFASCITLLFVSWSPRHWQHLRHWLLLLLQVVPEQVGGSVSEEAISSHAFELIFAFDEVVSSGGYR